jgi:hypothetical protein
VRNLNSACTIWHCDRLSRRATVCIAPAL